MSHVSSHNEHDTEVGAGYEPKSVSLVAGTGAKPRSSRAFWLLLAITLLATAGFVSLAVWQFHRRTWKLDLIAQIDSRIHAAPVEAPGPAEWASITASNAAYRRVRVHGVFLNDREAEVQAVTELGAGYWVVTPLLTDQGFTVLINRGFEPQERRDPATRPDSQIRMPTEVTGLLRITEPRGGFLRSNDPAHDRWFSRDVAAIARARNLANVAPYFIDADASPGERQDPVGGLTVVSLPNNHLVYALTWLCLAALSGRGVVVVLFGSRRPSHV
jgi:surfeit locus 1 family protein